MRGRRTVERFQVQQHGASSVYMMAVAKVTAATIPAMGV